MCCYLVAWLLSSVFLFCMVLLLFNSFTNKKNERKLRLLFLNQI